MSKRSGGIPIELTIVGGIIAVIVVLLAVVIGPKGCVREIKSWKADAYGSDWLVVQYAMDGSVIHTWELKNKSVGSESSSDGIFFPDNKGNIAHLSGHYVYVQVMNGDFDSALPPALPPAE